jgi:hypothetical protein
MAEADTHQLFTVETWIWFKGSPHGIDAVQGGTGEQFLHCNLVLPCQLQGKVRKYGFLFNSMKVMLTAVCDCVLY